MGYSPAVRISYEESRRDELSSFVQSVCDGSRFSDDAWFCNRLRRVPSERPCELTLRFLRIPGKYTELVKYYSVMRLMERRSIKGIQNNLAALSRFFRFLEASFPDTDWKYCGSAVLPRFKQSLDGAALSECTKHNHWEMLGVFYKTMHGWENAVCRNPFTENPYIADRKYDAKYIPQAIANKLDVAFREVEIPLHLRCIYWILRLIPSRINEVLAMKLDCLKPYDGHYCLSMPTWKQNGGYLEPEIRVIHLKDVGAAGELIELVLKQQKDVQGLQNYLNPAYMDYFFVHRKPSDGKLHAIRDEYVNSSFRQICEHNGILDRDGKPYKIATHQFRHNGITDRLAAGFTPEQIRFMTAHHGDAMITKAYNHLNLLPETIHQKQSYVLKESVSSEPAILFGGRILNMEEQLEKRLLRNIRAHRVMGGICSDITGCKGDMTQCLECESFVPDASQLTFYEEQVSSWYLKAERFAHHPQIKATATRNAEMFQNIVQRIHGAEGICDE